MSVFAQTSDGDALLVQGQLVLVEDVAQAAAIELRNKFLFNRGEYFLDTREGFPWFHYVFIKNPDVLLIKRLFTDLILSVQGIVQVLSLTVTRSKDRKGHFSFRAKTDSGRIISGGSGQPFIVEPK